MDVYKHRILIYIVMTYALSWIIWAFSFIFKDIEPSLFITIGTFVPSIIGIFLYFKMNHISVITFLSIQLKFRLKAKNYFMIFLLPMIIIAISYGFMKLFSFETSDVSYRWFELPIVFITILFLMGPLGEEFGWRGYLHSVLKEKYNLFHTSLIIGLIWSIWHLPLFFIEGALQNEFTKLYGIGLSLSGYLIYTVMISLWIGVYFEKTKRSIVTALIIHTMANLAIGYLPLVFNQNGAIVQGSVMLIVSMMIFIKNYKLLKKKP